MKTFEEALNVIAPTGCGEVPVDVIDRMKDMSARNVTLIGEIVDSEHTQRMLEGILEKIPIGPAMMSAVVNGVLIGIEMERAETGKLAQ